MVIASDDVHTRAWVASAVEALDIAAEESGVGEFVSVLNDADADLAIVDVGREPAPVVGAIESAAGAGSSARLLLLVEPEALSSLRLPTHIGSDFLVRGASSDEVRARVRTLLWPGEEASTQELVRVDGLAMNLATYQAQVDGVPVDFTYLEYALFAFLVTHPNRVYSREVLLKRVWGTDYFGGSRTVDVHVRRIRAKIGAELSRRLRTVRSVGYMWSA